MSILSLINKHWRASLCWSPELCFTQTMLGPIHLAAAHTTSCQHFPLRPGRAHPISGVFELIPLILPLPTDTYCLLATLLWSRVPRQKKGSCPVHVCFFFSTDESNVGVEKKSWQWSFPLSQIIQFLNNPTRDDVSGTGFYSRWNIGLYLSCRNQLCLMKNKDLRERKFPAL